MMSPFRLSLSFLLFHIPININAVCYRFNKINNMSFMSNRNGSLEVKYHCFNFTLKDDIRYFLVSFSFDLFVCQIILRKKTAKTK